MKKIILILWTLPITTVLWLLTAADTAISNDEQQMYVVIYIFSGRPDNPMWNLSEEEVSELKSKLVNLPPAKPLDYYIFPGGVGIGCKGGCKRPDFPYASIFVMGGVVEVRYHDGRVEYYKDVNNIEGWIYDMAPSRGYEIIKELGFSSNHTTAHRYKPYSDPEITFGFGFGVYQTRVEEGVYHASSEQGKKLKGGLIIVNDGKTKQLEGTITLPEFLTINKNSFSVPPSKEETFRIEVNTSEPRQIIGEIIIKSNDPDESIVTLPINIIIESSRPLSEEYKPITITETSFKETVKQGTELTKKFKIINHEETKVEGVITVPDFLTIDKKSFLILPNSSEDFIVKVDTSKLGQLEGNISIVISYFENGIRRDIGDIITVNFTITPSDKVIEQQQNYNNYIIIAIILITIFVFAFVIWHRKFREIKL